MRRGLILAAVVAALIFGAAEARADTIDMEGIASTGSITTESGGSPRTIGSFFTATEHGHYFDSAYISLSSGTIAANGTDYFVHDTASIAYELARTDAGTFTADSFDATEYWLSQAGGHSFFVTGHLFGGGTVSQTFTTDGSDSFETFTFNSAFTNLIQLDFFGHLSGSSYTPMVFDDIVLDTGSPVPEPGSCALLGLGLIGLGFAHRRRKARA